MAKPPLEGLATLVICLAFLVTTFQEVPAPTTDPGPSNPPDSDGKVPIKRVCYDERSEEAWFHRDTFDYADGRQKVVVKIYVDTCELRDLGARRNDLLRFIAHEKAHAKGWEHGEGTPETNSAYYPTVEITGR